MHTEGEWEALQEEKRHWWVLACQRFASMTKAREILGNIEESPFKNEGGVDDAIQEAHDILDTALHNSKEKAMQNDGSEAQEVFQSNIFEISQLQGKLKRAKAQGGDGYGQFNDACKLLTECRDLLEVTALESPLRKDNLELIAKIDEFYPQGE